MKNLTDNFTIKSQEAVQKAMEIAMAGQNQSVEPAHLLKGMLSVDENVIPFLLKKLNVNVDIFTKALERRFQPVMVNEPDTMDAVSILRGIKERYESHHKVRIRDEAIIAAVKLSQRYISDRCCFRCHSSQSCRDAGSKTPGRVFHFNWYNGCG